MTRLLCTILALLIAVATLAAACGGMSASDYLSTLEGIAKEDLAWQKSYAAAGSDSDYQAQMREYLALGVKQQQQLQEITPPSGFASAHSKLLTSYEQALALNRAMIGALEEGDAEAYDAAYQGGMSQVYSANAAFMDALSAAADTAGVQIPGAIFQDFPTSESGQPAGASSGETQASDTGPGASSPEAAIRGHWAGEDGELWVSSDTLTLKVGGELHTASYVVTSAETDSGWGDSFVRLDEDWGGDVFTFYEGSGTNLEAPIGSLAVQSADRLINLNWGGAYVGWPYVDSAEAP